jgi:hypothetical protein
VCYQTEDKYIDTEGRFAWSEGEAVFNFGRYRGKQLKEVAEVDTEYLQWVASADFSPDVREIAAKALSGEFPEPPEPFRATGEKE